MVLPSGTTPLDVAPSSLTACCRKTPGRHQRGRRSDALRTPAGLSILTVPVASSRSLLSSEHPGLGAEHLSDLAVEGSRFISPVACVIAHDAYPRSAASRLWIEVSI